MYPDKSTNSSIVKLNEKAAEDGETVSALQKRFFGLIPAFVALCGEDVPVEKKKCEKKPQERPKTNLIVLDGWGICPKCGKKCIRLRPDTILARFPMYCKACKGEYAVNWKPEK